MLVVGVLILLLLIPFLLLSALLMVNRLPDPAGKKNVLCASHGALRGCRVDTHTHTAHISHVSPTPIIHPQGAWRRRA